MTRDQDQGGPAALHRAGAIAGGLALGLELLAPGLVRQIPLGPLWVNVLLVAGMLGLFLLLFEGQPQASHDRLLMTLIPFLAAGILARLLYMDPGTSQAVVLREAAVPEAIAVSLGLTGAWLSQARAERPARLPRALVPAAGWLVAGGLLVVHLGQAWPISRGSAVVLGLTVALVALALVLQHRATRRWGTGKLAALATPPALAVAGAQLLDGVVSYLAVGDPLDLLAIDPQEGVLVSRAILEHAGPLFPLIKWGVALAAVVALEAHGDPEDTTKVWHRTALLILVAFLGLGPGLFSSLKVLGA